MEGKVFRGAELNAIFGGIDYDLRGAVIEPDCAIKATAIFGGIDIIVPENVKVRARMLELGIADENTKFICNHFSHNGIHAVYDEFLPIAAREGFDVSYDGKIVEV